MGNRTTSFQRSRDVYSSIDILYFGTIKMLYFTLHHLVWKYWALASIVSTPREEIAFTARPKIRSQSQILRYGRSIFCLPHGPNFSDIFDLCLHWVSVVRGSNPVTVKKALVLKKYLRILLTSATSRRVKKLHYLSEPSIGCFFDFTCQDFVHDSRIL